jgi:hypothetical protein
MFEDDDNIADDELALDDPGYEEESDEEILEKAKKDFERVYNDIADQDNKEALVADTRFAQLGEQWDERIREERTRMGKPTLTYNKLNAVIRQVVNDARQNKPSIKVLPVDDAADPQTAEILAGLIRNIEYVSKASVAYDTAAEHAAAGGHGYWQIVLDYARNDSYELDLLVKRVINPCSVYGDPDSEAADSSDWNTAFIVERYSKAKFEKEFGKKGDGVIDWDGGRYGDLTSPWKTDEGVLVANHWCRKEIQKTVVIMSDGSVIDKDAFTDDVMMTLEAESGVTPVREVTRPSYEVWQYILTGAEVLKRNKWPGQYIPIVPVYGNEYIVEGRRYFRGVIHDAKDAQQAYNFWRSTSTELVSLAPKAPWVAQMGSIPPEEQDKWETSNRVNHTVLYFDGPTAPSRMPMDMGTPAGAINEALSAADDIKAITGIYDASLGARSNETSGVAINARKVEGDTSTFNFPDNVARAINHTGVILLDVIPKVYSQDRIIRVLGEDEVPETKALGSEMEIMDPETGQPQMEPEIDPNTDLPTGNMVPMTKILDLTVGKYDVSVQTGPSYTTRRQEAQQHMTEIFRSVPDAATAALDLYMKFTDMPGADELAKRFKEHFNLGGPSQETQELQGQLEEMNGQMEQAGAQMQALQAENEQLKNKAGLEAQQSQMKMQLEMEKIALEREKMALTREELQLEAHKLQIEQQKIAADVEKERIKAEASRPMMVQPAPEQPMHRMPGGHMMPGAMHGENVTQAPEWVRPPVANEMAPTPY